MKIWFPKPFYNGDYVRSNMKKRCPQLIYCVVTNETNFKTKNNKPIRMLLKDVKYVLRRKLTKFLRLAIA